MKNTFFERDILSGDQYSQKEIRKIIEETPITEFRSRALKLISLLLSIKHFKYVSRSING